MTDEEIKKIAEEYGEYESKTSKHIYPTFGNPTRQQKERAKEYAVEAMPILTWLSERFCIVPKEQVYMRLGVANALMEQDPARKEFYRGMSSAIVSIFGKDTFEEERK